MSPQMHPENLERLTFLNPDIAHTIAETFGTPTYVYDESTLKARALQALAFSAPYGLTVRYAMKANPLASILRIFLRQGIKIDASSGHEAVRAMRAGFAPSDIMITSQQIPDDLKQLCEQGVQYNATSLHQLKTYGNLHPGTSVSIRVNPAIGSGHSQKTNTGGPTSSFGIWHEQLDTARDIASEHNLTITKLHTHIGSGTDPKVWVKAARLTLAIAKTLPDVHTISLGGGFKVARMATDLATNLAEISPAIARLITDIASETGRKLHLEIEPGTYLVANAGAILAQVIDITNTGANGHTFLKLNTGLTEIMRPSLYAAQHPIIVLGDSAISARYVVVGHTCESGDLLTPSPTSPDQLAERTLSTANIGDLAIIEGTGAYCAAMSAGGYNSFPVAPQIMLNENREPVLVARGVSLDEMLSREL